MTEPDPTPIYTELEQELGVPDPEVPPASGSPTDPAADPDRPPKR